MEMLEERFGFAFQLSHCQHSILIILYGGPFLLPADRITSNLSAVALIVLRLFAELSVVECIQSTSIIVCPGHLISSFIQWS